MTLPPGDDGSSASATAELFRLRRHGVVDASWHLGFVTGFAVAGVLAFGMLAARVSWSPASALFSYISALCLAGLVSGVIGSWIGHFIATVWERWDLRRHPRRYESGSTGA
jgi:hypothetical protein